MAKQTNTTEVLKREYRSYRDKSMQFFGVMKTCLQDNEWDAVLLNGVHATISMADSITVFLLGKRSIGKSHHDSTLLLNQAVSASPEGRRNADRVAQILNYKHTAEYESQRSTEREANDFAKIVERFIDWGQKQLPD